MILSIVAYVLGVKLQEVLKQRMLLWHRIVVFAKTAEFTENYVKKGALIYVEGRIHTRQWEDKEEKRHYMTEIVGDKLIMLSGWKKGSEKSATIAVAEAEEEVPF